jgi:hypothetical protein
MNDFAKIEEIYHAALEKPLAERDEFLKATCGDDEDLRREVESLLFFDEQAADFIEKPPEETLNFLHNSNSCKEACRFTFMPKSKFFSASPLTIAARWKIISGFCSMKGSINEELLKSPFTRSTIEEAIDCSGNALSISVNRFSF